MIVLHTEYVNSSGNTSDCYCCNKSMAYPEMFLVLFQFLRADTGIFTSKSQLLLPVQFPTLYKLVSHPLSCRKTIVVNSVSLNYQ